MIEIDLIRHVKVSGKSALYGCTDVAPIATENSRLLKRLIAQQKTSNAYQMVVSSPLIRCQKIAKDFSKESQLPLTISPTLQEMNFGIFDGVPFDDLCFDDLCFGDLAFDSELVDEGLINKNPELLWSELESFFNAPAEIMLPEAELLTEFHKRVILAWSNLVEKQINVVIKQNESQIPKRILLIAHGGVIRMILAHILQLDWQQASWHQKLQIGHGSLSRISINIPYQNIKLSQKHPNQQQPNQQYEQLHQQVTSIAIPFLEGF